MTNPNHTPLVSVGIPTYNRAESLKKTIASVINQTYSNLEIIISDNASTDSTQQVCEEFCQLDPRITYIRQPKNFGANNNFKFVLDQAEGEYFMWLGDDDQISNNFVEECLLFLIQNSDFQLCCGHAKYISNSEKMRMGEEINLENEDFRLRVTNYFNVVQYNGSFYGIYRRFLLLNLREILGQNIFAGDWIFLACLSIMGKVKSIDTCYIFRKDHEKEIKDYKRIISSYNIPERLYPYQYIAINFLKVLLKSRLEFRQISLKQKLKLSFRVLKILFVRFHHTGNFSRWTFLVLKKIASYYSYGYYLLILFCSWSSDFILSLTYTLKHLPEFTDCLSFAKAHNSLPTIAIFSPVNPIKSGVSDYTEELVLYLSHYYNIFIFIDSGYTPKFKPLGNISIVNYKLFEILSKKVEFKRVIYQVGHNKYHNYMFRFINRRKNDIIILHDGININGKCLTRRSNHLLVAHNRYAFNQIPYKYGSIGSCIVPMLVKHYNLSFNKDELRKSLNLENKFVFLCFGIIDSSKLIYEIINAFIFNYLNDKEHILLIIGHQINDERVIEFMQKDKYRNILLKIGLPKSDLYHHINASDVCLNLRSGTRGETSSSLMRVMSCGIPVVVSDTGSFSELPDNIVYKICANPDTQQLSLTLRYCCSNIDSLRRQADNALEYINSNHSPEKVVFEYSKLIQLKHK